MNYDYMEQVMVSQRLECSQKMIMVVLMHHADASGICWPSQETIAREAGLSRGRVNTHLQALKKLKYVKDIGYRGRVLQYQIFPLIVSNRDSRSNDTLQQESHNVTAGVSNRDSRSNDTLQRSNAVKYSREESNEVPEVFWDAQDFSYRISEVSQKLGRPPVIYPRGEKMRGWLDELGRTYGTEVLLTALEEFYSAHCGASGFDWREFGYFVPKFATRVGGGDDEYGDDLPDEFGGF